jgi:hypothetical protein
MQQNIGATVIGDDEAKPFGDVEPLDRTGDLDDVEVLIGRVGQTRWPSLGRPDSGLIPFG